MLEHCKLSSSGSKRGQQRRSLRSLEAPLLSQQRRALLVFLVKGDRPADLSFLEDQWESSIVLDPASEAMSKTMGADDEDDMAAPAPAQVTHQPPIPVRRKVFAHVEVPVRRRPATVLPPPSTPQEKLRAEVERHRQKTRGIVQRRAERRLERQNRPRVHTNVRFDAESESDNDRIDSPTPAAETHDEDKNDAGADDEEESMEMGFIAREAGNTRSVLSGDDKERWQASIAKELQSIESAGIFEYVQRKDMPGGAKAIDSQYVHTIKVDPSGGDDHTLKTRLVARGFSQRRGLDYVETFSPVGHRQSLRQMLSIVARENFELQGLDISTAFLHGDLDEGIYMRLPQESVGASLERIVRLRKSLYGLKQAGRCWNRCCEERAG